MILLPTALSLGVGMAAMSSGDTLAAGAFVALAAGTLLGTGFAEVSLRRAVATLDTAAAAIAEGAPAPSINPGTFGPLTPVARRLGDVCDALRVAREEATTDRLTQVANRPTLLAQLFTEVERASRHNRPLSIAFIDLDHFKAINDTYGHAVGDTVLHDIAGVFREHTRGSDFVGRYGGEEFVLVLPETMIEDATAVAENVRRLILRKRFAGPQGGAFTVSVSIGIAGGRGPYLRVDQLLRDADAAMYAAKSLGRNQTYVFAETDDDTARIPRAPISAEGRQRAVEVGDYARHVAEAALAAVLAPLPHYGGQPSSLIAAIAVRLAVELGLPEVEVERIRIAALLHDVGKLAVPECILEKPGPLDPDEWLTMVQHPRAGDAILERVAAVGDARAIILHHHEHYSGHGYPYGLRGSDIPLGARIVAIADAYDAMVRDRPYRLAIGHEAAVAELRRYANVQFDPELVALFCDLYAETAPRADPGLLIRPEATLAGRRARPVRGNAIPA